MSRLLSSKSTKHTVFQKPSKPCHVGIYWIPSTELSQMSTHVLGFQSFSCFSHHFVLAILATSSIRVSTQTVGVFYNGVRDAYPAMLCNCIFLLRIPIDVYICYQSLTPVNQFVLLYDKFSSIPSFPRKIQILYERWETAI